MAVANALHVFRLAKQKGAVNISELVKEFPKVDMAILLVHVHVGACMYIHVRTCKIQECS